MTESQAIIDHLAKAWFFCCPNCRSPLVYRSKEELCCTRDGLAFPCIAGIWRLLTPAQIDTYRQFIEEYEAVRKAEGRGSPDAEYYRALPFDDLTGKHKADWLIRSKSYRQFIGELVSPAERQIQNPLRIIDLGAGNGWLSYQLTKRGHQVAAVDLITNDWDGLGSFKYYDLLYIPIQADFNRLPFCDLQFDLAVFNASFHYSSSYLLTLQECLRILAPGGRLVILDTPVYHNASSGASMVRERESEYERKYSFPSNSLGSENYLTYARLDEIGNKLNLDWKLRTPIYGFSWWVKPIKAKIKGDREPAKFHLIYALKPNFS